MKRFVLALLALSWSVTSWAFPVDVEVESEGVTVVASSAYLSNIATVTLRNEGAQNALCQAQFVNGPERPPPSRVRLAPGEQTVMTQAFKRAINRVRVAVSCGPG